MSTRSYAERQQDFNNIMDIVDNLGVNSPEIFAAQWALEYD